MTSCPLVVGKIGCDVTRLLIVYVDQSEAHTDIELRFLKTINTPADYYDFACHFVRFSYSICRHKGRTEAR